MTILFLDTETTGLRDELHDHRHPSQPHLVQLGCLLTTDTGGELATVELIVRPEGYVIPDAAARIHGITNDVALAAGVPLRVAVAVYANLRALADQVVAHNAPFDRGVMATAIHRTGRAPSHPGPALYTCTRELAVQVVMRRAGADRPSGTNLDALYTWLFKEEPANRHTALADVSACARIYFELKRREREPA